MSISIHQWITFSLIQFNVVEQLKYLGVHIRPRLEEVLNANYEPLMIEMNESVDQWMSLPLSVIGIIHILNMNFHQITVFVSKMFTATSPGFF